MIVAMPADAATALTADRLKDLVADAMKRCNNNPYDPSCSSVEDMVGDKLSVDETKAVIDKVFRPPCRVNIQPFLKSGAPSCYRHPLNQRGDAASISQKVKSIEEIGLQQELSEVPSVIRKDSEDGNVDSSEQMW